MIRKIVQEIDLVQGAMLPNQAMHKMNPLDSAKTELAAWGFIVERIDEEEYA